MTKKACGCAAHQSRRYQSFHGHLFDWDGDDRFIAITDGRTHKQLTPWFPDGTGPLRVECPDCGEINLIGPEVLEEGNTHAH